MNTKLEYEINPLTEITFKNNFQGILGSYSSNSDTDYLENSILSSQVFSNSIMDKSQYGLESSVLFKKKYIKKGRNWISSISYKMGNSNDKSDVINESLFDGFENRIDQNQTFENYQNKFKISSNFTEPISKRMYLGLNYKFDLDNEKPIKKFFDQVGDVSTFNEDLSSSFQKNLIIQTAGISFKKNSKKIKFNARLNGQFTQLNGIINNEMNIEKPFKHLLPSMGIKYDFSGSKSLSLDYSTNINTPSLRELSPIPDNSNPNSFFVGNSELTPSYHHNLRMNYNLFDQFNFTNFFSNINLSYVKNRIINKRSVASDFTSILTPINTDKFISADAYFSFSRPFRPLKIKYQISSNINFTNYDSFINEVKNNISQNNSSIKLKIENRNKKRLDIGTGIRLNMEDRKYAINSEFNQRFFNYDWYVEGDILIKDDLVIDFSYDYKRYSGEFFAEERNFHLLNLSLAKTFFDGRFSLKLTAHDLLNQNIGLQRSGNQNSLIQNEYNTLSRYFMLGASYKLSKSKKSSIGIGQ